MIFTKLGILTCLFYIAIVFLMDVAVTILARWMGGFGIAIKPWGWVVLFGLIWLISFSLAWRFFHAGFAAKLPGLHS
jgi:hypothetical protein